jgi:hypothetical protein
VRPGLHTGDVRVRLATAYLIAQSILVAAWWLVIVLMPDVRGRFRPNDAPDSMLLAFWLADVVCIVLASAVSAWLVLRRDPRRVVSLAFTSGALVYASLYCATLTFLTREAWLGVVLMIPATAATLAITRAESR